MEIFDSWVPSESTKIWLDYNNISWNDSETTEQEDLGDGQYDRYLIYSLDFLRDDGSVLAHGTLSVLEDLGEPHSYATINLVGGVTKNDMSNDNENTGDFGDWLFGVASDYMNAPPSDWL